MSDGATVIPHHGLPSKSKGMLRTYQPFRSQSHHSPETSYILYVNEVLFSRTPPIVRDLAGLIQGQVIPMLQSMRKEKQAISARMITYRNLSEADPIKVITFSSVRCDMVGIATNKRGGLLSI